MTDPLKPLRAQILPKQVSPKPLPRNPTHNPDKQSRRLEIIKRMRISRPSWNPGDPPAPWWTRRRPRTARSASDSARISRGVTDSHVRAWSCGCGEFSFWSLRDRSRPWRARRRPCSHRAPPRGRRAPRRPWRSRFARRRARGGGRWRTPPSPPPRPTAPWSQARNPRPATNATYRRPASAPTRRSNRSAQVTRGLLPLRVATGRGRSGTQLPSPPRCPNPVPR
jgi:hypothetical protein